MSVLARIYRPLWHSSTHRDATYLLLGLLWGIVWPVTVYTMYAVGIATAIVWVGVPLLVVTHRAMRWIGSLERAQVRTMLGEPIPEVPPLAVPPYDYNDHPQIARFGNWMHAVFHDIYSWRALLWITFRLVAGPIGFVLALVMYVVIGTLLLTPVAVVVQYLVEPSDLPGWQWWLLAGPVAAAIVGPMLVWGVRGWSGLHRIVARSVLGPCEVERTRQETARAERAEQQVRIDQELHDSIGHMITMNIVQAGAGAHVFDSDPDFARQALRNIEERGRAAMGELDRIIATIRGDETVPRTPLAGVADLPALVESSRAAGMDVEALLDVAHVPAPLGRAAYAVVREGVTNAAKHAPGASVHVHVERADDAVAVGVVNGAPPRTQGSVAGHSADRVGGGRGLTGVHDRVSLLGGQSVARHTDQGGFELLALIPLEVALTPAAATDARACCPWGQVRAKVVA